MNKEEYAIECYGITKSFGEVTANDCVNLQVKHGEIMALLGENGSGKTTLMNMLSGIYQPDKGVIKVNGKKVNISSPAVAGKLGIGMIHQHFKLVDVMSTMDNIVLGVHEKRMRTTELRRKISNLALGYGLHLEPDKKVYLLSVSEKQTVEIMKVLYRGAEILILDEPTAVLTPQETTHLFQILKRMKENGSAIIIITHKLNEVMEISDKVMIMRKGRSIKTVVTADTDEKLLTELMVGRSIDLHIEHVQIEEKEILLKAEGINVTRDDGSIALKDVSFHVNKGEILGVAGISGSGQKELCESVAGIRDLSSGTIYAAEKEITGRTPVEIQNMGVTIGFVPEDRLGMGLVASMSMTGNMLLKKYDNGKGLFVDRKSAEKSARELIDKLDIITPNIDTPVRLLSGGNVQKVLLGREIESNPDILIVAYPVRGLDINSSYTVYRLLNEQKKKKTAIIFVGEDLDVLLEISDRIMVLCHGEVTGIVDTKKTTKEELGRMMTGEKGERKE